MSPRTAQFIFILLNIIAIFAIGYVAYDFISVYSAIDNGQQVIPFDTGVYYLLLMSVFWVLSLIQYAGLRNRKSQWLQYANPLLVGWFVFMLLLANLFPYYLSSKLEASGYIECADPAEISRTAKGESRYYVKSDCKYLEAAFD